MSSASVKNEKTRTEHNNSSYDGVLPKDIGTDHSFKREIVWFNAIGFLILHLAALYGVYRTLFWFDIRTFIWTLFVGFTSGQGVTIGAHRLYAHKSFKATFPVRLAFVTLHTIAGQNCLWVWVRDHRQHHKFSDTDADPHNATRGFFFSHIGWLMSKKHPAVLAKGKHVDMSDLDADPIVMFQKRHYKLLYTLLAIVLPTVVPVYFWGETYWNSFCSAYLFRNVLVLNITWLVNSLAHFYGTKPFDRFIRPVQSSIVAFVALGEGWHNYHHAFPWDYRTAELGSRYNISTTVIDLLANMGLVYDRRTTPYQIVRNRAIRTGDGSYTLKEEEANYLEELYKKVTESDRCARMVGEETSNEDDEKTCDMNNAARNEKIAQG